MEASPQSCGGIMAVAVAVIVDNQDVMELRPKSGRFLLVETAYFP